MNGHGQHGNSMPAAANHWRRYKNAMAIKVKGQGEMSSKFNHFLDSTQQIST